MKELYKKYKEIILYIVFGVLTTVVSWISYALLFPPFDALFHGDEQMFALFGMSISYTTFAVFLANLLSWIISVAFAFVTNKIWVFESKSWKPAIAVKELWLFVSARLITGILEWVFVPLLQAIGLDQPLTVFGKTIEGFVAKVIVSVVVIILNYVFSKLIIFKKKEDKIEEEVKTEQQ